MHDLTSTKSGFFKGKIGAVLIFTYISLFVVLAVTGVLTYHSSSKLRQQFTMNEKWSSATLDVLSNFRRSAGYIQVATLRHRLASTDSAWQKQETIIDCEFALNQIRLDTLRLMVVDPEGRALIDTLTQRRLKNATARSRLLEAIKGSDPKLTDQLIHQQNLLFEQWHDALTALAKHTTKQIKKKRLNTYNTAQSIEIRTRWLLSIVALLLLVLGALVVQANRKTNQLIRTNASYAQAIDRGMLVCITDAKGCILNCNKAFAEATGYSSQELKGANPRVFNSGHHTQEFFKDLWDTLLAGQVWTGEFRNKAKDGSLQWYDTTIVPLFDIRGIPNEFVVMRKNVTIMKTAADTLRIEHQKLDSMLNSIGDAVIVTDSKGHVTRMNPVAETLTAWPAAQAHDQPISEVFKVIHQYTRQHIADPVSQVLTTGKQVSLANHTALLARDGRELIISDSGSPIRNASGGIDGVILVFKDDTQRHNDQLAILESEERYRKFVEDSSEMIFSLGLSGEILFTNSAWHKALGYSKDDIAGMTVFDIIAQESLPECQQRFDKVLAGQPVDRIQSVFIAKEGNKIYVEGTTAPRIVDGQVAGVLAYLTDMTDRVLNDQLIAQAQQLNEKIIDNLPGIFCILDRKGYFVRWNNQFRMLTGHWPQGIEQVHGLKMLHDGAMSPQVIADFKEVIAGNYRSMEVVIDTVEGPREYLITGCPLEQDGKQYVLGMGIDVSARRLAENKLRESEAFNKGVLSSLPSSIAVIDKEGHILAVNRAWNEFGMGNGGACLTGLGVSGNYFTVCTNSANGGDAIAAETLDGIREVLAGNIHEFTIEYPCHSPDVRRWFLMRAIRFEERTDRLVIAHIDITQRKLAEEALQNLNTELDGLVKQRTLELTEVNRDLTDSIVYAKRIQDAVLSSYKSLLQVKPDIFLFSMPQSIVSGDMMWWAHTPDGLMVAAIDCTGHGVPGAFMSIIVTNLLNTIVHGAGVTNPAKVLHRLNEALIPALGLNSRTVQVLDGVDMALCLIVPTKGLVKFAGAYRPLYVTKPDGTVEEIRGSVFSIGGGTTDFQKSFTCTDVPTSPGTMLYLYSDGLQSQFGGPLNKKFGKQRLRELFSRISNLPMNAQRDEIARTYRDWKNDSEQTDDLLVLGIRM